MPGLINRSASFSEKEDCTAAWIPGLWRALCKEETTPATDLQSHVFVCLCICIYVSVCACVCMSVCGHERRLLLAMLVHAMVSKIINVSLIKVNPKLEFMKL